MSTSIVVLKTGDQIICDLKELFDGDGENKKGICLLMRHPFSLSIVEVPIQNQVGTDIQVKFTRWCPYSTDVEFKLPYDVVMSVASCEVNLEQAYLEKINSESPENVEGNPQEIAEENSIPLSETEVVWLN